MSVPEPAQHGDFAALGRLLAARFTCRQFQSQAVSRETFEQLFVAAQRTPSWCNTQPWETIVTEGAGTERFRAALLAEVESRAPSPDIDFPARYTGRHQDRRRECGLQLYSSVGIVKGDVEGTRRQTMRNFEFFDAPHVAIVTTPVELGTYGAIDCGLYINSVLLAAHSLGLAAAPQAALASYSSFVRAHFDIPDDRQVVVGISLGYPDLKHEINGFRTSRAPVADVIRWHAG